MEPLILGCYEICRGSLAGDTARVWHAGAAWRAVRLGFDMPGQLGGQYGLGFGMRAQEAHGERSIRMKNMSTLCYIERDGAYLMLHRTVKENDVNRDKWIGVGGHFEDGESPEECVLREVREETGYTLTSYRFRGLVTFVSYSDRGTDLEYMSLFTADDFTGEPIACDEGQLEWVPIEQVWRLNLWEGDKIFFRLLDEEVPFFSLKLVYDHDRLKSASLNGKPMELFDILDEDGNWTGLVRERGVAHRDGSRHPTSHIWIARQEGGRAQVLLQKRSMTKDSYPGCYDISSAGHVGAGEGYLDTALRELHEELGIVASEEDLEEVGTFRLENDGFFYGKPFHDREFSRIYVYRKPVKIEDLSLQEAEVSQVCWMDYEEVLHAVQGKDPAYCVREDEFLMVGQYLERCLKEDGTAARH